MADNTEPRQNADDHIPSEEDSPEKQDRTENRRSNCEEHKGGHIPWSHVRSSPDPEKAS